MSAFVYVLLVFDRTAGTVVEEVELTGFDPHLLRDVFAPGEQQTPFLFDSYPVEEAHLELFRDSLPQLVFDVERFAYFTEANTF